MTRIHEPGGPHDYEVNERLQYLIEGFHDAWMAGDTEKVAQWLLEIEGMLEPDYDQESVALLTCRAENCFTVAAQQYNPSRVFLDGATSQDEPLRPDGKGPRVTGEVVGVVTHEIPGRHHGFAGHQQISPMHPGVLLREFIVEGVDDDGSNLCLVPLLHMSEPATSRISLASQSSL